MSIKYLCNLVRLNVDTDELTIKLKFLTPEKMEILENLIIDKSSLSFTFSKPNKTSKTYKQLKMYYRLLKLILQKREIDVTSQNIKALDLHIKKNLLQCEFVNLDESSIPIIPSKANLSLEEMKHLIENIIDLYDINPQEITYG